jgi:hypothetical protein
VCVGGGGESIRFRVRLKVRGRLGLGLGLGLHTRPFVQAPSNPFRIRRLGLGLAGLITHFLLCSKDR